MLMIVLKNYPPLPIHSLLTCRLTFTCSLVNCLILHPLTAHGHLLFASIFSFPPINPPIASSFARHPAHRVVIFRRCLSTLYLYLIFPPIHPPNPPLPIFSLSSAHLSAHSPAYLFSRLFFPHPPPIPLFILRQPFPRPPPSLQSLCTSSAHPPYPPSINPKRARTFVCSSNLDEDPASVWWNE